MTVTTRPSHTRQHGRRRAALAGAALLLVAACGDDGETQESAAPASPSASPSASASPTPRPECPYDPAEVPAPPGVTKDLTKKPAVPKTSAKAPTELQVADVVVGKGPVVETLSSVDLKYVGGFHGSGKEFDSSWSRGPDETFSVRACAVGGSIVGFAVGPLGMRQGGRRVVTIPSALAYGDQGQPPTIPPKSTLVFVVDAVRVS